MFLLFASTSDVEQMGLQLSLESVQSSLVSVEQQEDCSTETVRRLCDSEDPPADHGSSSGNLQ